MTLVTVPDRRRRRILGRLTGMATTEGRQAQALVRMWASLNGVRIVRLRRTASGDILFTGVR